MVAASFFGHVFSLHSSYATITNRPICRLSDNAMENGGEFQDFVIGGFTQMVVEIKVHPVLVQALVNLTAFVVVDFQLLIATAKREVNLANVLHLIGIAGHIGDRVKVFENEWLFENYGENRMAN